MLTTMVSKPSDPAWDSLYILGDGGYPALETRGIVTAEAILKDYDKRCWAEMRARDSADMVLRCAHSERSDAYWTGVLHGEYDWFKQIGVLVESRELFQAREDPELVWDHVAEDMKTAEGLLGRMLKRYGGKVWRRKKCEEIRKAKKMLVLARSLRILLTVSVWFMGLPRTAGVQAMENVVMKSYYSTWTEKGQTSRRAFRVTLKGRDAEVPLGEATCSAYSTPQGDETTLDLDLPHPTFKDHVSTVHIRYTLRDDGTSHLKVSANEALANCGGDEYSINVDHEFNPFSEDQTNSFEVTRSAANIESGFREGTLKIRRTGDRDKAIRRIEWALTGGVDCSSVNEVVSNALWVKSLVGDQKAYDSMVLNVSNIVVQRGGSTASGDSREGWTTAFEGTSLAPLREDWEEEDFVDKVTRWKASRR